MTYQKILVDVLVTVAPPALAAVAAYATKVLASLSHTKKFGLLATIALHAVQTAEELGHVGATGPEKLEHATTTLQDLAGKYHLTLTDDQAKKLVLGALTEFRVATAPLNAALAEQNTPGTEEWLARFLQGNAAAASILDAAAAAAETPQELPATTGDVVPVTVPVTLPEPPVESVPQPEQLLPPSETDTPTEPGA